MTCCVGSFSAHFGNSQLVAFDSKVLFFVIDSMTHLLSNTHFNIKSTTDAQSKEMYNKCTVNV
jgi:hypothetical protein